MVKNGRISADEEPFQHLLAILGIFMHLPSFLKTVPLGTIYIYKTHISLRISV